MTSMHTLFSVSKYITITIILSVFTCSTAVSRNQFSNTTVYIILPQDKNSLKDNKWTEYLTTQSQNRSKDIIITNNLTVNHKDSKTIYVHVDNTATNDYSISINDNKVRLTASSDKNMLWLIYQWIATISENDNRWNVQDLDPAIIDLKDSQQNFDFRYRSIYSSAMNAPDKIAISGDQHVDYDWGIWGHNLKKVFKNKEIPLDAMATINGKKTNEQFCFSSEILKKSISEYISDSYGNGEDGNTGWFSIIPNDNMKVCTCDKCKKVGNTDKSATPAVTSLIIKLAKEFPFHNFYTSAYNSTTDIPKNKLPENIGVIISAMDLPLNTLNTNSSQYTKWKEKVHQWQLVTNNIIIWDYMRNFDDYFTPYPCLLSIQNRLKWFKSLGIYGVFYNGSGDDYSTFDDLQTFIVSTLLKKTDIDVRDLTMKFLKNHYPQSYQILFDYYSKLEEQIKQNNITLEWYTGIDYALKTYLNPNDFKYFYQELDKVSKRSEDEKRKKLNMILTALNFTQLEIIRSGYMNNPTSKNDASIFLELLEGYSNFKNMNKYKEANGSICEYINAWNKNIFFKLKENLGVIIKDEYSNGKLTDGYYGFSNDYHLHWIFFNNKINELNIHTGNLNNKLELEFSFLYATKWKIGLPSKIEVYQDQILKKTWIPSNKAVDDFSVIKAHMDIITNKGNKNLKIIIYKGELDQIACDEIEIYNLK